MSDNGAPNGSLGAFLAALVAAALAMFLLFLFNGGMGKKTVNSDADLPPIAGGGAEIARMVLPGAGHGTASGRVPMSGLHTSLGRGPAPHDSDSFRPRPIFQPWPAHQSPETS